MTSFNLGIVGDWELSRLKTELFNAKTINALGVPAMCDSKLVTTVL